MSTFRPDHATQRHLLLCFGEIYQAQNFSSSHFTKGYENLLINHDEASLNQHNDALCRSIPRYERRSRLGNYCHFFRLYATTEHVYGQILSFSSIQKLEIVVTNCRPDFTIIDLLNRFQHSLVHLKLACHEAPTDEDYLSLINSINLCTQLKSLTLDFLFSEPLPQGENVLPNFSNLNEFIVTIPECRSDFFRSFGQVTFPAFNDICPTPKVQLRSMSACGQVEIDILSNPTFNDAFANCFEELPQLMSSSGAQLHQRFNKFNNLRELTLNLTSADVSFFYSLINLMLPFAGSLTKLDLLDVTSTFFESNSNSTVPSPLYCIEQLIIVFSTGTSSNHSIFSEISWNEIFPALENVALTNVPRFCSICDKQVDDECKKLYYSHIFN